MPTLLTAPTGEAMFAEAIALALRAQASERADLFERLTGEIEALTTVPGSGLRPWTRTVYPGTDGSRIFRGTEGSSLVIDPAGRLWRARSGRRKCLAPLGRTLPGPWNDAEARYLITVAQ